MRSKSARLFVTLTFAAGLQACSSGTDGESQFSRSDLEQFAAGMLILAPADGAVVSSPITTVRVDVSADARVEEMRLLVDGIEVALDQDGAPWEIEWPSYYWGDNNVHSLTVHAELATGQLLRSSSTTEVLVTGSVNSALRFEAPESGTAIQDQNTLDVEAADVASASGYEIEVSGPGLDESYSAALPAQSLTDLEVGLYMLRYRAVGEFAGNRLTGPWSANASFSVLRPDLPTIRDPVIDKIGDEYEARLSWWPVRAGDSYTVELRRAGSQDVETFTTTSGELIVSGLPLGEHYWKLRRTNAVGHVSEPSDPQILEAGVFTRVFGGSEAEQARSVRKTNDGGAIILASTASPEVSGLVDSRGDDWIIRVDERGEIVWDYLWHADWFPYRLDIIELSDGSFIALGASNNPVEAVALKLSSDGIELWKRRYAAGPDTTFMTFGKVLEHNGLLYAISQETQGGFCPPDCADPTIIKLITLDPADGALLSTVDIPAVADKIVVAVARIIPASTGGWLLGASAVPSTDPILFNAQPIVMRLDNQFQLVDVWQETPPQGAEEFIADIVETSDGSVAALTESHVEFLGLILVSPDLQTHSRFWQDRLSTNSEGTYHLTVDDENGLWFLNGGAGSDLSNAPVWLSRFDVAVMMPTDDVAVDPESPNRYGNSYQIMDDGSALVLITDREVPGDPNIILKRVAIP